MEVFRLSRAKYAATLSGKGAAISGARWNPMGIEMIYTASSRSLAMAEVAVHLTLATVPKDYEMITIHVPDSVSIQKIREKDLPARWTIFPHLPDTEKIGEAFILANQYCILQVPSAVVPGDYNYLINPGHAEFAGIQITSRVAFPFDERLFR